MFQELIAIIAGLAVLAVAASAGFMFGAWLMAEIAAIAVMVLS